MAVSSNLIVGQEVVEWVAKRTQEFGNYGCAVGIGWLRDCEIVAGVVYNEYNGVNINAHISLKTSITKKFLWTIFDYPFNQAKVKRLTAVVAEGNTLSRNLVQRLGFSEEAKLKDADTTGDLIVYRMFKDECKWLDINHGKMNRSTGHRKKN